MLPELKVKIGADTTGLDRAVNAVADGLNNLDDRLKRAAKGIKDFGQSTQDLGKKMLPISGAVSGVIAGVGLLVTTTANAGNEISNFARISGTTAEEFQRNAAAARAVGIEQEKLADIYKDMNDRVGDFLSTGGGPMADFFENIAPQVGVTADQFARLSGPEAMQLYVDSLEKAGASQQEMTFYMEALAGDASSLIPLLRDGGAEMTRLGDAAQEAGAIMDSEAIAASREFSEQMRTLQDSMSGATQQIGQALLPIAVELAQVFQESVVPAIVSVAEGVASAIDWFGQLPDGVQAAAGIIAGAFAVGAPALMAIGGAISMIGSLAALFSPAGLIIGGLVAATLAWMEWGDDIKAFSADAFDWVKQKGQEFLDFYLSIPSRMLQIGRDILSNLIAGIKEGIGGLADIGAAVRDGLIGGIKGAAGGVWDAAKGLAGSIIGGSKEELESNSPSLAMMRVGQDVGNGLILGMDSSRGMVGASAAAMAGDIKSAFGGISSEMTGMGAGGMEGGGFFSLGAQMIQSLASGILSAGGIAGEAAMSVAQNVKSAIGTIPNAISGVSGMVQSGVGDMADGTKASSLDMAKGVVEAMGQMFQGSKPIAIAQALINTYQGITKALAQGGFAGIAQAAAVAAQGFAAVRAISSAKPGSGTPTATGGGGAATGGAGAASGPQIFLDIQPNARGDVPMETFRGIIQDINDQLGRGGQIVGP
jgi:hypothetical protein